MFKKLTIMLLLTLTVVCPIAWGVDDEVATSSTSGRITLERAILDFNEESDADRERLGLTRLTDNELLAAIRGTTGMPLEDYKLFTQIAETKRLPENAKLMLYRRHFANGYKSSIWKIVLSIKKNDHEHVHIDVRNQYLSTERDTPFLSTIGSSK